MILSMEKLRRLAKALRKSFAAGEAEALARVRAVLPEATVLRHADALHVIAREYGHTSWPCLKFAAEAAEMDRAAKLSRLGMALYHGQHWVVQALLAETPDLARAGFGIACALYDVEHVRAVLDRDPEAVTREIAGRRPLLHLAFSKHLHGAGSAEASVAVAELLVQAGADVKDFYYFQGDEHSPLSALYGALGHANNMLLAEWLLDQGADPNDGESLYHATELGHRDGLRLLLKHGALPARTNALPRALDFNDHEAVQLLLDAGADPNEGIAEHSSGEPPFVIPALHQAARRMCDARMIALLLEAGADPSARYKGLTPYAYARVYGNAEAAELIAEAGGMVDLTPEETLLAAAADGTVPEGAVLDPTTLNGEYRVLPRTMMHLPGKLPHIKRLIEIGLEPDLPDAMGLPPVQIAGWEGLPEALAFFLSLGPDLTQRNTYGGDLMGTIVHGSENAPRKAGQDHIACARMALDAGMPLHQFDVDHAGNVDMAAFLTDWAEAHPERVV